MVIEIVLLIALYFVPWFVAVGRNHKSSAWILIINLFFAWTLLGWIVCLAWALHGVNVSFGHSSQPELSPPAPVKIEPAPPVTPRRPSSSQFLLSESATLAQRLGAFQHL